MSSHYDSYPSGLDVIFASNPPWVVLNSTEELGPTLVDLHRRILSKEIDLDEWQQRLRTWHSSFMIQRTKHLASDLRLFNARNGL